MNAYTEKLDALRKDIAAECELRMEREGKLSAKKVAEWLLRYRRAAVVDALQDLVCQVMEQSNDSDMVQGTLRAKPELRERAAGMRSISQTLGVPLWYLLQIDDETAEACVVADLLIHQLRIGEREAVLEGMKRVQEYVRPVTDGHPQMTLGDAFRELEQQTNDAIRNLDPGEGTL
jgi:hypothetical protein